jgi:7,8-dihydro-6-hydroxymethylpterin dimethyltransferase
MISSPGTTLGMTQSVCNVCGRLVPAKVESDGQDVYFRKFCTEHGESRNLVRRDSKDYLTSLRYVKPAWTPLEFAGDENAACPDGCGMCSRHEQHLCMPIIEITSRCDLSCPVCLVDAGGGQDMKLVEFRAILDGLLRAERQIDVLNLSGGEPLLHSDLLSLVDEALARPEIIRVSISTNGLKFLETPGLLQDMRERNVVISLQFDGFDDRPYEILRGRKLLAEKLRILEMLAQSGRSASMTVTLASGVNDDQLPQILNYYFAQPHLVSLMIQPLAFAGRGSQLAGAASRLTIPDVVALLDTAGGGCVHAADFAPLPCSHPLCFSLAYYLMLEGGGSVTLNSLIDASRMMDTLANRTIFGLDEEEHDRMKDLIYELWSGPVGVAPDGDAVMRTLRKVFDELSCGCFDPRKAFAVSERRIKSIFIHAFQDRETFDLARVRRCCNAYPQTDGKLIPACVHNVMGRKQPNK